MIRLVTLDAYDPKVVDRLCKVLYTAFGVGCEHAGDMPLPAGQSEPFDAETLLQALPTSAGLRRRQGAVPHPAEAQAALAHLR